MPKRLALCDGATQKGSGGGAGNRVLRRSSFNIGFLEAPALYSGSGLKGAGARAVMDVTDVEGWMREHRCGGKGSREGLVEVGTGDLGPQKR